jgi:hypothetical protein
MANNPIRPDDAEALFDALKENRTVTTFLCANCGLGDDGAAHLAVVLSVHPALTTVDVAQNDLSSMGAAALAA